MRIGILGGTFNPVHLGHLLAAQSASEQCSLDRVWFMPCNRPPHKTPVELASAGERLLMLRAALGDNPRFSVSRLELLRGGVSYAVDTFRALHSQHPGHEWFFIAGMDSLLELHRWREVNVLLDLCTFVTLRRPGSPAPPDPEQLPFAPPLSRRLVQHVYPGRNLDLSSSEIRNRVAAGLSIRYLVPDAVAEIIRQRGLYASPQLENGHRS